MKKTCLLSAGLLSLFCIVTCYGPPENSKSEKGKVNDFYFGEYPTPYSPATTIEFETLDSAEVTLEVYNVKGEIVDLLVDTVLSPGRHLAKWDGSDQLSGVYFYKITEIAIPSGDTTVTTEKMILLK